MALLDIVSDTGGVFQTRGGNPSLTDSVSPEASQTQERGNIGVLFDTVYGDAANALSRGDVGAPLGIFSLEMVFFTIPEEVGSRTGLLKVWNGAAWVHKPLKVWGGSSWNTKPVKFWSGSAWVLAL